MSALAPTACVHVAKHGSFILKSTLPVGATSDVLSVTIPAGLAKDAVPVGPAAVYTLSVDTYTRNVQIAQPTAHDRSVGITTYAVAGTVAAGSLLFQEYVILGAG